MIDRNGPWARENEGSCYVVLLIVHYVRKKQRVACPAPVVVTEPAKGEEEHEQWCCDKPDEGLPSCAAEHPQQRQQSRKRDHATLIRPGQEEGAQPDAERKRRSSRAVVKDSGDTADDERPCSRRQSEAKIIVKPVVPVQANTHCDERSCQPVLSRQPSGDGPIHQSAKKRRGEQHCDPWGPQELPYGKRQACSR